MLENPSTSCGGTLAASVSAAAGGENVQAAARSAPSRPLPLTTPNFAFMGSLSTMKNEWSNCEPDNHTARQGDLSLASGTTKSTKTTEPGRLTASRAPSVTIKTHVQPRLHSYGQNARAAKTALLRTSSGTACRAPTEILEQDRPHHIAPVLIGVVVKGICADRPISPMGILRGDLLKILAGEEVAVADLELKLLFKGPEVVNV